MTTPIVLTDDLLVRALTRRASHEPDERLVSRIVAGAVATSQVRAPRRWWGRADGLDRRPRISLPVSAFVGAAAVVLVVALAVVALRPTTGPAGAPRPSPTSSPAAPTARPNPGPTAEAVPLGATSAVRLPLGTGPIDVVEAFDSIWVAEIFSNRIVRLDPTTLAAIATVHVSGPGWFAVAGDAFWVTNQLGNGLTRIDPVTNTTADFVGGGPACGAPVVVAGSIWQSLCDADAFVQVDVATSKLLKTIPAQGNDFLVEAGGRLITLGPAGLAILDPGTGAFAPLPGRVGAGGELLASDGEGVWIRIERETRRIDPLDGHTIAAFPYGARGVVTISNGHAWLTQDGVGVVEVDLATNAVVQVIPVPGTQMIARELAGVVWVTSFDNNEIWRIQP